MTINKTQARLFRFLRLDVIQHLSFGFFVAVVTFCFFAIHAWYQGRVEILESFNYKQESFWLVFGESFSYTLLMAMPVYFNLFFVYQGRVKFLLVPYLMNPAQFKNWSFFLFFVFSLLISAAFGILYSPLFALLFTLIDQQWYEIAIVAMVLVLSTSGLTFTKETIERNREAERRERREAIRRRREVERELDYIRKQVRPHFLFNTLANLQILARQSDPNVPHLIGELSKLLRHLVYRTAERFVPLEQELEFISSYINLQRLQLSAKTQFDFNINGEYTGAQYRIAPMVLLLFVENSFKHYNRNAQDKKFIGIEINILGEKLELSIRNSYKTNARNEGSLEQKGGFGLHTATENLQMLYGDDYQLSSQMENGIYELNLQLPLI